MTVSHANPCPEAHKPPVRIYTEGVRDAHPPSGEGVGGLWPSLPHDGGRGEYFGRLNLDLNYSFSYG